MVPDDAFAAAANLVRDRDDLGETAFDEAGRRWTGDMRTHTVTVRVIESTPGRSRVTVTVGGGNDPVTNESLAAELLRDVCARFPVPCE
jgi:hypothetical protein